MYTFMPDDDDDDDDDTCGKKLFQPKPKSLCN